MRADNTHHLRQAVQQRQSDAWKRARNALSDLQRNGEPITVAGLARAASVARSWIYAQPELLAQVQQARQPGSPRPHARHDAASHQSWQQRLELAHQRIHDLTIEIKQLREQLARAHGQLRAERTAPPATKTPSTTQTHC